ncbi:leucine-rich repeat domain-containing protein [Aporhodopirellula aestuarii]|nr:hypothetical protein [Aporhodopirellula aestuarii]
MDFSLHIVGGEQQRHRNSQATNSGFISVMKCRSAVAFFLAVVAIGNTTLDITASDAADRTRSFLPIAVTPGKDELNTTNQDLEPADAAILRSGVLPTEALGIGPMSRGGDLDWWRYIEVWRAHHENPASTSIRRWLTLPQHDDVQITTRSGRGAPKFLPWRPASFVVAQTPHFEILSRASTDTTQKVARDLERFYWTWTQIYFPLWSGRDQTAISLAQWDPESSNLSDYLSKHAASRLSLRRRHRVVLLPDERSYQLTISYPQISAGQASTIAASAGFYSDTLETSFFFPQDDASGMAHETCHQLFEEASDRKRSRKTTLSTKNFWLVEGIAGHFESLQTGSQLACVGGWDSNRLQYARYQTLIARAPVASIAELRGDRHDVQRRSDLATWYSQAILQTHFAMDDAAKSPRRKNIYLALAEIYGIDISDFACLHQSHPASPDEDSRVDRFLMVDDHHLIAHPIPGSATTICLAGCEVSLAGWKTLPQLPQVHWFDASRTPIDDEQVARIIGDATSLDQLSLEATKITPMVRETIRRATDLRELDLSWTPIDDSVIESIAADKTIETIWLTGTAITDASIAKLSKFPNLQTVDVQRTRVNDAGLQQLRAAISDLDLNPLQLTP